MNRYKIIQKRIDNNHLAERFLLPVESRGVYFWSVIDTGGPHNLLPLSKARKLGLDIDLDEDEVRYPLISGVEIPYVTRTLNFSIKEYSEVVFRTLDLSEYEYMGEKTAMSFENMEFRIPLVTFQELKETLETSHPRLSISDRRDSPFPILGLNFINRIKLQLFEDVKLPPKDERLEYGLEKREL